MWNPMLTVFQQIGHLYARESNLQSWTKYMEITDGKMASFGFYADSSLIWGDGCLVFDFILSKIVGTSKQSFSHKE